MDEGHAAHAKLGFRTTLPDTSIVLEAKTPLLATSYPLCEPNANAEAVPTRCRPNTVQKAQSALPLRTHACIHLLRPCMEPKFGF